MKDYVRGIDGLRAIAVMAVLVFHAFPASLPGGFIGVDVFFVISGFIITRTYFDALVEKRQTLGTFFLRRVRRLAPIYVFVLVAATIGSYVILIPINLRHFAESLLAQPLYLQNVVFWFHGDYFEAAASKPLLHTWSLAVEEQFYLSYAVLILVIRRVPRAAIALIVLALLASLGLAWQVSTFSPKTTFYWLPPRMWELLLGVLTAIAVSRGARSRWLGLPGLALVVWSIAGFDEHARLPGMQSMAACAGTAFALLTVTTHESSPMTRALAVRPVAFVGKLSYSLYLWHWPIIALAVMRLERPLRPLEGIVAIAVTAVVSWVGYEYVERPVREKRFLASNRALVGAAGAAAAVVCGIAVLFVSTAGATFRYPPEVARLFVAQQNRSPYRCPRVGRLLAPRAETCRINDATGDGNVLVLGDSHADVVDEVVAEVAAADGRAAFLTKRDCKLQDFGVNPQCGHEVLAQIKSEIAHDKIRTVFALAYVRGDFPDAARLEANASELSESVDRLFIVQVVPYSTWFHPADRAEAILAHAPLPPPYTLADYHRENAGGIETLRHVASKLPRVTILDPSPYICPRDICEFDTDGVPNYFDAHHLSPTGARRLIPLFSGALRSVNEVRSDR